MRRGYSGPTASAFKAKWSASFAVTDKGGRRSILPRASEAERGTVRRTVEGSKEAGRTRRAEACPIAFQPAAGPRRCGGTGRPLGRLVEGCLGWRTKEYLYMPGTQQ